MRAISPRSIIKSLHNARTTPVDSNASDIYVVEFPKSGITWLSHLLVGAALSHRGSQELPTFTNIQSYIYDIHMGRRIGTFPFSESSGRLIKSHSEFNPRYQNVIYLARNPTSVMKSYFKFQLHHSKRPFVEFSDFIRDQSSGVEAWKRHFQSWMNHGKNDLRLHVLTYEALVQSPSKQLSLLSTNFGLGWSNRTLSQAVKGASEEEMKRSEGLSKVFNPTNSFSFVKSSEAVSVSGVDIRWIEDQCKEEIAFIRAYTDKICRELA